MVWFALVQISALSPEAKKTLENADGAFLNVAYQAENTDHLKAQIEYTFGENGFTVYEIDEIKYPLV